MERLFSPCTRHRDSQAGLEEFRGDLELLQGLKLDVSTEDFLSAKRAFTYADLYVMLGNGDTVLWLTPHASIVRSNLRGALCSSHLQGDHKFSFNITGGKGIIALARSSAALLEIVDVVCRLLVAHASEVYHLELRNVGQSNEVFCSAPVFASLAEQCQSLKSLTLENITLDEGHCRVLGDFSKPGLEVELKYCRIVGVGAEALADVLGRNQGPTKLNYCEIESFVLANGLRGNSRLKSLTHRITRNQDFFPITGALKENKGLVDVHLRHGLWMSDETWDAVYDSLKTHPSLQVLSLRPILAHIEPPLELAQLKSRIQAIVDMLKVNMSIVEIHLADYYSEHELFRGSVIPYLETNRLRPRVRAIQQTRAIAYRVKVLGEAFLAVRTDANSFWMLLSGNAEVALP
jgi:hypothetical protein